MKKYRYIADSLTVLRMICALLLLLPEVFSAGFYMLYLISGISDMLDGFFARKSGGASSYGALLDSGADLMFTAVCLIRILPVLSIPPYILVSVAAVVVIRLVNIAVGYIRYGRLILLHTKANRLAGLLLFLLPPSFLFCNAGIPLLSCALCALFASVQEGYFILAGINLDISEN